MHIYIQTALNSKLIFINNIIFSHPLLFVAHTHYMFIFKSFIRITHIKISSPNFLSCLKLNKSVHTDMFKSGESLNTINNL